MVSLFSDFTIAESSHCPTIADKVFWFDPFMILAGNHIEEHFQTRRFLFQRSIG